MGEKKVVANRVRKEDFQQDFSHLIEGLQFSPQEFYSRIERALERRQVPDLVPSRVDWKEGGPLSARREYLRLQRERLMFDVCGMPFGTGFYVSEWYGERPLRFAILLFLNDLARVRAIVTTAFAMKY
jgi:hypothetical protein